MKTDLHDVLTNVWSKPGKDLEVFPGRRFSYESIHQAIAHSRCSKMLYYFYNSRDLWDLTPAGLIASEAFILSGAGKHWQVVLPTDEMLDRLMNEGQEGLLKFVQIKDGVARIPTYGMLQPGQLNKWLTEASPFIEDGRLGYIPIGAWACAPLAPVSGEGTFQGLALKEEFTVEFDPLRWADIPLSEVFSKTPPEDNDPKQRHHEDGGPDVSLLSLSMPYIAGLPFSTLYKVLSDEEDALVRFRAAFASAQQRLSGEPDLKSGRTLDQAALLIRTEILEPEVALLNQRFARVLSSRALKVAGAALGTIALTASAACTSGPTTALSMALGAGGLGLLAREYADFRADVHQLKESPWFLAWRLERTKGVQKRKSPRRPR